jgi:hypothetical protein
MTPNVAVAALFEGTRGPMRIGIFVDEIDALHVILLGHSSGGSMQ